MARIITRGHEHERFARHTCSACDSLVEFDAGDVERDPRGPLFVRCPVCQGLIDFEVLGWQSRPVAPSCPRCHAPRPDMARAICASGGGHKRCDHPFHETSSS